MSDALELRERVEYSSTAYYPILPCPSLLQLWRPGPALPVYSPRTLCFVYRGIVGLQLGKLQFSQQFANIQQLMMAMAPAMGPPMPMGAKGGARVPVASQRPPSGEYGYEAPPPAVQTAPQGQGGQLKR